jgi:biotin carboxyl carrier protein
VESEFVIGGERHRVAVGPAGLRIDGGETVPFESVALGGGTLVLRSGDRVVRAVVARAPGGAVHVAVDGRVLVLEPPVLIADRPGRDTGSVEGHQTVVSPMPGQVGKIPVAVGDEVHVKQTVAIVVAMKMENEVRAALDGVVTAIHVEEGEQVTGGQRLLEIESRVEE